MSIMYCMDHDSYYDSDFVECPQCEENISNDAETLTKEEKLEKVGKDYGNAIRALGSPTDENVVSPTIPERVEEFKKEFWKLSGDSVTELDRKQDEYVQNMLTETDQQAREEDSRYRKIAELITSIFYYGNFKAETANERELEKLLREVNLWPTNEQIIIQRTPLSNPPSQV